MSLLSGAITKKFGIVMPTSTAVQKTAATCAARSLGTRENTILSNQMSYNPHVHSQYYAAVRGRAEAAEAAIVLEKLRHAHPTR